jgi:hypothetical protein
MRNRPSTFRSCTLVLVLALSAAATVGCSAPSAEDGMLDQDIRIGPRPPAPFIGWQFRDCITPNQRAGLAAALLDFYARFQPLHPLAGLVGDSQCLDGEEKGGLFAPNLTAAQRASGLKVLSFRPTSRLYAFQIGRAAVNAVSAQQWASVPPLRFNDAGERVANGRYELLDYSDVLGSPDGKYSIRIIDTQAPVTVDVVSDTHIYVAVNGSVRWSYGSMRVEPASSPDPFVQTVINATVPAITKNGANGEWMWVAFYAQWALSFADCPSLKGWPLQLDTVSVDGAGNIIESGGALIL